MPGWDKYLVSHRVLRRCKDLLHPQGFEPPPSRSSQRSQCVLKWSDPLRPGPMPDAQMPDAQMPDAQKHPLDADPVQVLSP